MEEPKSPSFNPGDANLMHGSQDWNERRTRRFCQVQLLQGLILATLVLLVVMILLGDDRDSMLVVVVPEAAIALLVLTLVNILLRKKYNLAGKTFGQELQTFSAHTRQLFQLLMRLYRAVVLAYLFGGVGIVLLSSLKNLGSVLYGMPCIVACIIQTTKALVAGLQYGQFKLSDESAAVHEGPSMYDGPSLQQGQNLAQGQDPTAVDYRLFTRESEKNAADGQGLEWRVNLLQTCSYVLMITAAIAPLFGLFAIFIYMLRVMLLPVAIIMLVVARVLPKSVQASGVQYQTLCKMFRTNVVACFMMMFEATVSFAAFDSFSFPKPDPTYSASMCFVLAVLVAIELWTEIKALVWLHKQRSGANGS